MNAKTIVLFNHKGGVSKTTDTYYIAWKLTELGKRVLLVDGDPQCNLTGLMMGQGFEDYYTNEATKRQNIKDGVSAAFEAKPCLIEKIKCFSRSDNDKLFLIPGHMDLSAYESELSLALNSNNAIATLQNLPGAFYRLISLCCEEYKIDYVFIDVNPGLGALNQTFFMLANGFIVPTNPDPFSLMALHTLIAVLPRWKKWANVARQTFKDASYPLPDVQMKFLGEIVQRFNKRNQRPAASYQRKIDEIEKFVEDELCGVLATEDMLFDISGLVNRGILANHCLAKISDFGALVQRAQEAGVPVFALTQAQLGTSGKVLEDGLKNQAIFGAEFERIAKVICEVLS